MLNDIYPIREITKNYDALIFDIWGVIYEGAEPYKNAIEFLNQMNKEGKKIIFLSNAPRPGYLSHKRFIDWGMNMDNVNVYTSGDQVREQLNNWNDDIFKDLGRKFYHLGAEKNLDITAGLDVDMTTDIKQANFLLLSLFMDEHEDLTSHNDLLKEAINLSLPAICANPDISVRSNNKTIYCSGTFAKQYTELGGITHYYGKPKSSIFNLVLERYLANYDRKKILMIGDTIETDIVGATKVGLDSALVLTGNGQKFATKLKNGDEDVFKACQARPSWLSYGIGF